VFGSDFDTPDGTAIRDYIHVADLADAHVAALTSLLGGGSGGVFNLGTGRGHSVREVLRALEDEVGEKLPAVTGSRRAGDPAVLVADPARAKAELGFHAGRSNLEMIVRTAWTWHKRAHPQRRLSVAAGATAAVPRKAKDARPVTTRTASGRSGNILSMNLDG
jgi:UDP-arabinose 4-epimerase